MPAKIDPELKKQHKKEYMAKWMAKNKDLVLQKRREYYKSEIGREKRRLAAQKRNNDPRVIAMRRAYYGRKEWKEKARLIHLSPKGKLSTYRHSAKLRNLQFEFNINDFYEFENQPCSYCGKPMPHIGLDRMDNAKGYTKENTIPCCYDCNKGKMTMNARQYIEHCKRVVEHTSKLTQGPLAKMLEQHD